MENFLPEYSKTYFVFTDAESIEYQNYEGVVGNEKLLNDLLQKMSVYVEEYENTYILPYGFTNSRVGSGHLNQYGHAFMADELYQMIMEDER